MEGPPERSAGEVNWGGERGGEREMEKKRLSCPDSKKSIEYVEEERCVKKKERKRVKGRRRKE
jgi:hypothetical protein